MTAATACRTCGTEPREGAVHGAQRTTPKQRVQAAGDGAQTSMAVETTAATVSISSIHFAM